MKNLDFVNTHVLRSYLDKITSLEGELHVHRLKKDTCTCILSLEDIEERMQRASDIDETLLDLRVAILTLMERTKKEPTLEVFGMPLIGGVNVSQIEVSTFDGTVLNWRLFWEQFEPQFTISRTWEKLTKLTYLWDALKDGPAMYVIQG